VGDGVPGAHEVVILSPAHDTDFGGLAADAAFDVLHALRDRAAFHLGNGHEHAQPFINHGKAAGASIEHAHAQLLALDFIPPRVAARVARGSCIAADRDASPSVAAHAWCPRGAPSPFLVRVSVDDAGPRFDEATDDELRAFSGSLQDTIQRLQRVLGDPAYNVVIETAPRDHDGPFHWWADVVPRLNNIAGFEMGTGVWVNTVRPADAAAALRDA
jgi:UDPglucose--hexose-1-phosphate uridylyltransferase